jgi:putative flippase GtrA
VGRQAAFLLSYPPALAVHFGLNRRWTFASREAVTGRQVGEYLGMVGITFVLQWSVFTALSRWTRMPGWAEAGLANIAQTAISFVYMQLRIFGERRRA